MKNFLLSFLLGAFCLTAPSFSKDIASSAADGKLWEMDRQGLARLFMDARFAPVDEETLRFPRQEAMEFGSLNVGDMLITFDAESKKVSLIQASVYNKGDDGPMEKKAFEELLASTVEKLDAITGVESKLRKVSKRDAGIKLNARVWLSDGCAILLEAAGSGKRKDFTAEFIRLTVGPDEESLERGGANDAARRSSLRGKTKTEDNGDVWIEGIPMVDQGQKGYCVPATVSRVFAYYGMDGVDQHALAALCKSSGDGGTSLSEMEGALEDISRSFHMRVNKMEKGGIKEIVAEYNAAAKKQRKPLITPSTGLEFDGEVLLAARASKPAQLRKWLKPVKKSISEGLPVLWSVQLVFPEEGLPQAGGGHMRLIIGYNEEEETIIYSDTWGAQHVRKTMPLNKAAAITMRRYVLRPTR